MQQIDLAVAHARPVSWHSDEKKKHLELVGWLVGFKDDFYFPIYWESSSQLTNILQMG